MASYDLIDDYLDALRTRLRWRGESDELDSELRDHLYTAAEKLEADGHDPGSAQAQVLDRFGEPGTVSAAFAASGTSGLAVPTQFTHTAGKLALIAAAAWCAVAAGWTASYLIEEATGEWEGTVAQPFWMLAASALLGGAALTVAVLVALHRRHGGLGIVGGTGIAIAGLGAAASFIGWFVWGWGLLLGLGTLLIAAAVLQRGMAPRLPTVLVALAWPVAGAIAGSLRMAEAGRRDEWGDYPLAVTVGLAVGCLAFAAGLAGLGRWMMHEEPVEDLFDRPPAPVL